MARLFLTLLCSLNLTLSLFTAAALAAPAIAKRTVTAYLSAINEQVAVLNTQLSVLPTAGVAELSQVLKVHLSMFTLASILSTPTFGVKEEMSADDTSAVLALLKSLVPAIEDALSQFIGKEGVIAATPDPTLVPTLNADLTTVKADTGTALDGVIDTLPTLFRGLATVIVSGLSAMFDEAIAAYS